MMIILSCRTSRWDQTLMELILELCCCTTLVDMLNWRGRWYGSYDTFEFPIVSDPDAIPIHNSPIVYNGEDRELVEATVRAWFEKGVIRRSTSPWAHQMLIAQQLKPGKDGFELGNRVCPNLIPINSVTKPMSYPLPNPREIVDRVTGKFKSVFDGSKGYLRFKLREEDKYKTAFIIKILKI